MYQSETIKTRKNAPVPITTIVCLSKIQLLMMFSTLN